MQDFELILSQFISVVYNMRMYRYIHKHPFNKKYIFRDHNNSNKECINDISKWEMLTVTLGHWLIINFRKILTSLL